MAEVGGELFLAPQDKPDQWQSIGVNYPVASGDNLWVGNGGRAEVDFGAGQFRLAGDSNIHLSRLDDRQFALFVAQGRVQLRVRVLDPGETARVDTPNAQIVLTRPGSYRVDVSEDRQHTQLVVREGEANVLTAGAMQQVLPGQTADVDGMDPQFANVRNGIGSDGFDAWAASRDGLYTRGQYTNYVSPQMVGAAELDQYGTWSQVPDYGAVWYPNDVGPDWAPYRDGYWTEVGVYGPTWVDAAPWGYAPFHYGRWAYVGGRWGWCPGAYVARPLWAPALVAWTGGPGWSFSVSTGAPVYGWVPLGWGEPFRPWWNRCSYGCWDRYNRPYAVNVDVYRPNSPPPTRYVNWNAPGGVTAVSGPSLVTHRPVQQNLVRVPTNVVATAPILSGAPMLRAEAGRVPTRRPGESVPAAASTFAPAATMSRPAQVPSNMGATPAPASGAMIGRQPRTATNAPSGSVPQGNAAPGAPAFRPSPSATPPKTAMPQRPASTATPGAQPSSAPSNAMPQRAAPSAAPSSAQQPLSRSLSPALQGSPSGHQQAPASDPRGRPVSPTTVQPVPGAQPSPSPQVQGGNRTMTRQSQGTPLPPSMTPQPSAAPAMRTMPQPVAPAPQQVPLSRSPAPSVAPSAPAPHPAAQPRSAPTPPNAASQSPDNSGNSMRRDDRGNSPDRPSR